MLLKISFDFSSQETYDWFFWIEGIVDISDYKALYEKGVDGEL